MTATIHALSTQRSATDMIERASALLSEARSIEEVFDLRDQASMITRYLAQRDAGTKAHLDAWEVTQRANRRLGQLFAAMKQAKGARTDLPPAPGADGEPCKPTVTKSQALKAYGVSRMTASRYEKLADMPDDEFRARLNLGRARVGKQVEPTNVTATSAADGYDSDSYGTPSKYAESARKVMGRIVFDPASNAFAANVIKADRFCTKQDSSLDIDWAFATIWLNQPYSAKLVALFANKLCDEYARYHFQAVNLVNSATETDWYQRMLGTCSAICLPDHRIAFELMGVPVKGNLYSQTFFYLGEDVDAFADEFEQYGAIIIPRRRLIA
jgi:hypothetical protein